MLPWLSILSVSCRPVNRLRHGYSFRYLRISPLHRKFYLPILHSSQTVSNAIVLLSNTISHPTCLTAYDPFTPSKSGQRSLPLYYRGCWHRVSRSFFLRYHQIPALFTQIHLFPDEKSLQSEDLHPLRGVAPSDLRPLWKIPYCCLP